MKNWIVSLLVFVKNWMVILFIFIIVLSVALFLHISNDESQIKLNSFSPQNNDTQSNNQSNNEDPSQDFSDLNAGTGKEFNGGSSSGSQSQNFGGESSIDIHSSECGLYYSQYGMCGGVCPAGTCISEEGSCYCKLEQ